MNSRYLMLALLALFGLQLASPPAEGQSPVSDNFAEFSTDGHPKAHGVSLTIRHPKEWQPTESKGAKIVQSFVKEDDRSQEGFWIFLQPLGASVSEQEIRDFLTEDSLRKMVVPGDVVLSAKSAQIAGMPVGVVEFLSERTQGQLTRRNRQLYFHFIRNDIYIQIQCICQTRDPTFTDAMLTERMKELKPVFHRIAESVTFSSATASKATKR